MTASTPPANHLLGRLSEAREDFLASLERIPLTMGMELERPGEPVSFVYFPEGGLASVIAVSGSRKIEVGMIGSEGVTGTALALGSDCAGNLILVQSPGEALRLPRESFLASLAVPELRSLWLRYAHVLTVQESQTALANGTGKLLQRLARWIVMWHDRIRGDGFKITHEYISVLLGVRRAGVTIALHHLEGDHLIRSNRNHITVLDRDGLVRTAGDLYGLPEAEYRRVIG